MSFYSQFAGHYDRIFPMRAGTLQFLRKQFEECPRLLDLGCGTGGYCAELAGAQHEVMGVDLDSDMIAKAKALHAVPTFKSMDLQHVAQLPAQSFDGIYCIGNVLPHLPAQGLSDFLSALIDLLRPDGLWIVQTVNFDRLLGKDAFEFHPLIFAEEHLEFQRAYLRTSAGPLLFRTRLLQADRELFCGETPLNPLISADLIALHKASGFHLTAHYGDFAGNAFDAQGSPGSVYVFERGPLSTKTA